MLTITSIEASCQHDDVTCEHFFLIIDHIFIEIKCIFSVISNIFCTFFWFFKKLHSIYFFILYFSGKYYHWIYYSWIWTYVSKKSQWRSGKRIGQWHPTKQFQWCYYGMNPLTLPAMVSIAPLLFFYKKWIWHWIASEDWYVIKAKKQTVCMDILFVIIANFIFTTNS